MSIRASDLWRLDGTIERGPYLVFGLLLFALKHNLDRFLASYVFDRPWGLFNYWIPLDRAARVTELSRDDALFLAAMVALALPFIWFGVALTVKRLRAVQLSLWLALLFFVPAVNLFLFLLLSTLPSKPVGGKPQEEKRSRTQAFLDRIIPRSAVGSAAMSLLLTLPFGVALSVFGAEVLFEYGWGLFVALPFALGLLATVFYTHHRRRSYAGCLLVSWLSILFTALALFGLAVEGLICIIMAAPIGVVLAAMGASLGYVLQLRPWSRNEAPAAMLVVILTVPGLMGAEALDAEPAPLFAVGTALEIAAPPEAVWGRVVAFSEIPEPDEWVFRLGIAYPIRAEIRGEGAGAVRRCEFSTGAFIEPIEVWDAPRRLKFGVVSNPAPMEEWTLYSRVEPPHLGGYLVSRGGEFRLTPLPGGGTRLEGTTWYHHHMWPATYWRWWSDWIIHRIHLRVLNHIKAVVESDARAESLRGT
ncbi:MAG: DUF805 domain-containing protein [Candidatus Acidiferrales bacterium]